MDTLPESKQAAIRKLRTVRLQKELIERGFDEEEVELMSRSRLEEEWGNIVALGRDTPPEGRSPEKLVASASDPNQKIEMRRLAFEERKYEEEKEERRRREEQGRTRDAEERAERKERELRKERRDEKRGSAETRGGREEAERGREIEKRGERGEGGGGEEEKRREGGGGKEERIPTKDRTTESRTGKVKASRGH